MKHQSFVLFQTQQTKLTSWNVPRRKNWKLKGKVNSRDQSSALRCLKFFK